MTHPPIRRMAPHPPQSSSLDKKKLGKPRPKCTTSSARASSSSNFTRFFYRIFFSFLRVNFRTTSLSLQWNAIAPFVVMDLPSFLLRVERPVTSSTTFTLVELSRVLTSFYRVSPTEASPMKINLSLKRIKTKFAKTP